MSVGGRSDRGLLERKLILSFLSKFELMRSEWKATRKECRRKDKLRYVSGPNADHRRFSFLDPISHDQEEVQTKHSSSQVAYPHSSTACYNVRILVSKKKYFCTYCETYIADDVPRKWHVAPSKQGGVRQRTVQSRREEEERQG
jgi:hypothetical protein